MTWLLSIILGGIVLFCCAWLFALCRLVWGYVYRIFLDPDPDRKGK